MDGVWGGEAGGKRGHAAMQEKHRGFGRLSFEARAGARQDERRFGRVHTEFTRRRANKTGDNVTRKRGKQGPWQATSRSSERESRKRISKLEAITEKSEPACKHSSESNDGAKHPVSKKPHLPPPRLAKSDHV
jgi:hypothetical protein